LVGIIFLIEFARETWANFIVDATQFTSTINTSQLINIIFQWWWKHNIRPGFKLTSIVNITTNMRHMKIVNIGCSSNHLSFTKKFVFIILVIIVFGFARIQYTKRTNQHSVNDIILLFINYSTVTDYFVFISDWILSTLLRTFDTFT
jgi:hypothetical protein